MFAYVRSIAYLARNYSKIELCEWLHNLRLSDDGELLTKKALFLIEKLDEEFFGIIGQKKENDFRELLLEYKKCL
ncbi:hypothetical protein RUK35_003347 [Vibrio cholerae]|nr:hypothetical protein [Vibrio cholerae]